MKVNTMELDLLFSNVKGQRQGLLQKSLIWVLVFGLSFNWQRVSGQEEVGDTTVTIKTPLGNVRGQRLQYKGLRGDTPTTVDKFLGIPFAEPPVGKLRFRLPKPHTGWTGTLEATTVPPGCVGKSRMAPPPPPPPSEYLPGLEMPEEVGSPPANLGFPPEESYGFGTPVESQLPSSPGFGTSNIPGAPQGRMPSWLQGALRPNPPSSRRRRQAPPIPEPFLPNDVPPAEEINGTAVVEDDSSIVSADGPSQEGGIPPGSGSTRETSTQAFTGDTTESSAAMPEEKITPSGTMPTEEIDMEGDNSTTPLESLPGDPPESEVPDLPPETSNATDSNQGPFGTSMPPQEGPFGTNRTTQGSPFGPRGGSQEGPFGPSRPSQEGPSAPGRPSEAGPFGTSRPSQEGPSGHLEPAWPSGPGAEGPPGSVPSPPGSGGGPFDGRPGTDVPLNMSGLDPFVNWYEFYRNFSSDGGNGTLLYALPPNINPRPPPMMHQPPVTTETSEDCLFLNIFVPRNKNKTGSLPVMVFLHGGGFTAGHALMNDLTNLAIETDTIVVTTAYRLHVYGFFSLSDSQEYPGNLGLWDQVAALQWVQNNIGSFGGDPQRVTLAGHSAGAISVSMHVASPASRGLFQAAFSMSGARFDLRSDTQSTRASSQRLLIALQCDGPQDHNCIMNATQEIVDAYANGLDYKPILDDQFFPLDPLRLVEMSSYNKVPYLFGINSDEGLSSAIAILESLGDAAYPDMIGGDFMQRIHGEMGKLYDIAESGSIKKISDLVQSQYMVQTTSITEALRQIIDLASDMFTFQIKIAADSIAAKQHEVYLYYFNHTPSATEKLYEDSLMMEVGAGHTEPLHLLFGRTDMQMSNYEQELCEEYLSSLKSFLHKRRPSLPGVGDEEVDWPAYDKDTGNFVDFGWQGPEVTYRIRSGFPVKTVSFWTDVLPAFINDLEKKTCPDLPPPMLDSHHHLGEIIVRTSNGRVRGVVNKRFDGQPQTHWGGDGYQMFLGIQYAAPPTGVRRWQDPEAPPRWRHIRQALSFPPSCPQVGEGNHNENCLHLNVWVPALPDSSAEKLPVLVYIHGGGFLTGNGNDPGLLDMSFDMESIVVSVNFRLGPLGFLSLGNDEYPGNYAHKDIIMALRWVQENIFAFGGNPCKVTLFGVDSGAALASQIALSRYAHGLITNVMTMGGSAKAPWANDLKPRETAKSLARKIACPDEEEPAMIDCLLQKDAMALASVQTLEGTTSVHGYTSPLASYPWRPVVEGIIDWSNPLNPKYPLTFLSGFTDHEGYQMSVAVLGDTDNKPRDNFLEFLERFVRNELQGSKSVYEAIKSAYFPIDVLRDETRFKNASISFWTDWAYLAPLVGTLSNTSDGYAYRMSYVSDRPIQPGLVTHGDDFNILLLPDPVEMDITLMNDTLVSLLIRIRLKSFINGGMPSDLYSNDYWPQYAYYQSFFRINKDISFTPDAPLDSLTAARIRLWTDRIPEMISSLSCTPRGHSSVPRNNNANGEDHRVPFDTSAPKDRNERPDTGPGENSGSSPSILAVTTSARPGIVGLALFESQVIMFALGGACVLLLLVIVILAMVNCSLKRRLVDGKNTDTFEDLKYATKM